MCENKNAWSFVEKHYPNYHQCGEIASADDLQKLLDGEYVEGDDAHKLLQERYVNDINNPNIKKDYNELHMMIYEKAIESFLEDQVPTEIIYYTVERTTEYVDQFSTTILSGEKHIRMYSIVGGKLKDRGSIETTCGENSVKTMLAELNKLTKGEPIKYEFIEL